MCEILGYLYLPLLDGDDGVTLSSFHQEGYKRQYVTRLKAIKLNETSRLTKIKQSVLQPPETSSVSNLSKSTGLSGRFNKNKKMKGMVYSICPWWGGILFCTSSSWMSINGTSWGCNLMRNEWISWIAHEDIAWTGIAWQMNINKPWFLPNNDPGKVAVLKGSKVNRWNLLQRWKLLLVSAVA